MRGLAVRRLRRILHKLEDLRLLSGVAGVERHLTVFKVLDRGEAFHLKSAAQLGLLQLV